MSSGLHISSFIPCPRWAMCELAALKHGEKHRATKACNEDVRTGVNLKVRLAAADAQDSLPPLLAKPNPPLPLPSGPLGALIGSTGFGSAARYCSLFRYEDSGRAV